MVVVVYIGFDVYKRLFLYRMFVYRCYEIREFRDKLLVRVCYFFFGELFNLVVNRVVCWEN